MSLSCTTREAPTQNLSSLTIPCDTLWVSVSFVHSCDNGDTRHALCKRSPLVAPQAEGKGCHDGTREIQKVPRKVKSNSPQGNAVGGWQQLPTCGRSPPRAQPGSPQPLLQVRPPLQAHFPAPGALPGRVQPRPPAGSPPGRGGSREGKNQKQIAGVNGAEPRAASAAAV